MALINTDNLATALECTKSYVDSEISRLGNHVNEEAATNFEVLRDIIEEESIKQKEYIDSEIDVQKEYTNSKIDSIISSYPKLDDSTGKIAEEYMPEKIDMAKDLTGVIEATPEEFNFRPSAGDKSIRDESAVIRSIKGNILVWNSLIKDYSVKTFGTGSRMTFEFQNGEAVGTYKSAGLGYIYDRSKLTVNHKYILGFTIDSNKACDVAIGTYATQSFKKEHSSGKNSYFAIISTDRLTEPLWGVVPDDTWVVGDTVIFSKIVYVDLTKMFGTGNEPSTIEEFYACIPQGIDIYSYNEGQIINNNVEGIKTVGFNQWDEEWILGPTEEYIVSKNFCKAIPNTDYYVFMGDSDGQINLNWYDSSYKAIRTDYSWKQRKFKSPERASFFKLRFFADYGITYKHDICINLSHSGVRNGEYEPYKENYRALPDIKKYFPDGMKSAGSVYDEITSEKAIQRVGVVDLGSLEWRIVSGHDSLFAVKLPKSNGNHSSTKSNILCTKYNTLNANSVFSEELGIGLDSTSLLSIYDTQYTDATSFKTAMSGVLLYYELAEPIETPLEEPIQLDYVVEDWGTEEAISDEPSAPFKADIVYQFNAEGRIRDNSRNIEILENTTVKSIPQNLSEDQKKQVRENIGAPAADDYDVEINPTLKFDIIEDTSSVDESVAIIGYLSDENYHEHNIKVLNYITDHQDIGVKTIIYDNNNGRLICISCMLNIDDYNDKKNYIITGYTPIEQSIYTIACIYEKVDNIYTFNQSNSDLQYYIFPLLNLNTGQMHSGFLPTNKLYFTMNATDNTVSQNTMYSNFNAQMISDIYSKQSSLSDIEVNAVLESTSSDVLYKLCLSNITKNENGMNLTFTSGNYIALLVELLNNESNDGFEFGNINISNNNPLWEIK